MSQRTPCYLRTLRREWGFTQEELARLVLRGYRERVSRVERGIAQPNAPEILAYSLIFGFSPEAIFPAFRAKVEDAVMRQALALYEQLDESDSKDAMRKKSLLRSMQARALGKLGQHQKI